MDFSFSSLFLYAIIALLIYIFIKTSNKYKNLLQNIAFLQGIKTINFSDVSELSFDKIGIKLSTTLGDLYVNDQRISKPLTSVSTTDNYDVLIAQTSGKFIIVNKEEILVIKKHH